MYNVHCTSENHVLFQILGTASRAYSIMTSAFKGKFQSQVKIAKYKGDEECSLDIAGFKENGKCSLYVVGCKEDGICSLYVVGCKEDGKCSLDIAFASEMISKMFYFLSEII